MIDFLNYLGWPLQACLIIITAFVIMQIIGEILEFKGKVVPEFLKVRKTFQRKKKEKKEAAETLKEVKVLLGEVNTHYSEDNITKRNKWMDWVNSRAEVYDGSIAEIQKVLVEATQALRDNTKLTEEMFIQNSRDRIIDFATRVADCRAAVSREEYNRIFKVYDKYEKFLEEHNMTNGEVDIAMRLINESYEEHMRHHSFVEDIRGYTHGNSHNKQKSQ